MNAEKKLPNQEVFEKFLDKIVAYKPKTGSRGLKLKVKKSKRRK